MEKRLTIFTPTYNRAYLLGNLYNSLKEQTCKDFVWIIIDDGSTDNTKDLADMFMREGALSVKYFYQENSGKYVAHNAGVKMCETELFVCVDSDDELYPHAVEKTLGFWEKVKDDKNISGIVSPQNTGGFFGFVNPPPKSRLMDLYNNKQLFGDTMLVFRADVLKKNLFPEIKGEKFMTECVIYHQIDQKYVLAVQDEILCKGEYRQDGLTANMRKIHWNNPKTTLIMYRVISALQSDFIEAIKAYGCYLAWKRVRNLSDYKEFSVKPHVAFFGSLLYFHYYRIFKSMKKSCEV